MNKYSKALLATILVFICSVCICFSASAANDSDVVVSLQINDPIMEINGDKTEIDAGRGTKPIVTDGRTLVPIRAIIEAFDGVVDWDGATQTVNLFMADDI